MTQGLPPWPAESACEFMPRTVEMCLVLMVYVGRRDRDVAGKASLTVTEFFAEVDATR